MLNKQKGNILYWKESMTLQQIADLFDLSYSMVWGFFKRENILRRCTGSPRKANCVNLTEEVEDFLNGLLLGDGCLTIGKAKSAYYTHGDKNKEYIEFLSSKFKSFGIKGKIRKYKDKEAYSFKSLHYYEFYKMAKRWYPNGKKLIPSNFLITPNSLKNWYIGDGNYSNTPLIDSSNFSFESLIKISLELKDVGINNTLNEFKDRKRIRISTNSIKQFFSYILSVDNFIPPPYLYKFGGSYA